MTLEALHHILRAARALAADREILVLGSASLLVSYPELGEKGQPLASTYDADICPMPFDEITGVMLDEALGENRAYYQRHGYHADILRDSILETLPSGWKARLISIVAVDGAATLDPHDLAAVKISVGRDKDMALVRHLVENGKLTREVIEQRIGELSLREKDIVRCAQAVRSL